MNLPELIKRLRRRYTMSMVATRSMLYDTMNVEREEAAEALEQLAAALAAKDKAIARHIKVDEFLTNCPSDVDADDHTAALEEHHNSLANMRKVAALQPHAELVAKMKADDVREAAGEVGKHMAIDRAVAALLELADRIERGEVK